MSTRGAKSYDQLSTYGDRQRATSTRARLEVVDGYRLAGNEVAAFTGEDGGSALLARQRALQARAHATR